MEESKAKAAEANKMQQAKEDAIKVETERKMFAQKQDEEKEQRKKEEKATLEAEKKKLEEDNKRNQLLS